MTTLYFKRLSLVSNYKAPCDGHMWGPDGLWHLAAPGASQISLEGPPDTSTLRLIKSLKSRPSTFCVIVTEEASHPDTTSFGVFTTSLHLEGLSTQPPMQPWVWKALREANLAPELTLEEKATNYETFKHIEVIRNLLNMMAFELLKRGEVHDQSKLGDIERQTFVEYTPKLKGATYGSEEYKGFLAAMKPALDHHYANNRHHPEHFGADGVNGMNLIDVLEMIIDWKAASLRHDNGDIMRSIDINIERFGLSPQLVAILKNTIRDFKLENWGR